MKTHTERLKKTPAIFRRLTGITPEKFDTLTEKLIPLYAIWNLRRLSRPNRQRQIGGGNKHALVLSDRLLLLLIYCRTYATYAFLGYLFKIDESRVGRTMKPLEPLLASIFRIPERKVIIGEKEIAQLFFDGTEQPTNRPKKKQKTWYSGKKKWHTVKHQVVVLRGKKHSGPGKKLRKVRIVAVSKTHRGAKHDRRIYAEARVVAPPGVKRSADLAYLGTTLCTPKKKPQGKELTVRQKAGNRRFSRCRIVVEHAIGKLKIWRICRDQYRGRRKNHALIFKNCAGLHNLMFA